MRICFIRLKEPRKDPGKKKEWVDPTIEELKFLKEQGLVRTGRLFGGLIDDIKRKAPWSVQPITFTSNIDWAYYYHTL